jgi:hypothetical protein
MIGTKQDRGPMYLAHAIHETATFGYPRVRLF